MSNHLAHARPMRCSGKSWNPGGHKQDVLVWKAAMGKKNIIENFPPMASTSMRTDWDSCRFALDPILTDPNANVRGS